MTNKDLLNRDPITDEPGSHPVGTGVGAASGALAGAAIGAVTAGPIGIIAGTMIGGIAGGLAGKEVAEANNPTLGGDREKNLVGEGVGASAGIMTGAALGSAAGPLGTVVGAGIGAVAGGVAGNKIEGMMDNDEEVVVTTYNNRPSTFETTDTIGTMDTSRVDPNRFDAVVDKDEDIVKTYNSRLSAFEATDSIERMDTSRVDPNRFDAVVDKDEDIIKTYNNSSTLQTPNSTKNINDYVVDPDELIDNELPSYETKNRIDEPRIPRN